MSNSNTTQETLEIMKESEKKLVEESVNKNKFVSRSPSKEEVEKDGEEISARQESQVNIGCDFTYIVISISQPKPIIVWQ